MRKNQTFEMKYSTPDKWTSKMADYAVAALEEMRDTLQHLAAQNNQKINFDSWTFKFREAKPEKTKSSSDVVVLTVRDHNLFFVLKRKDESFGVIVTIPDIEEAQTVFWMCSSAQSGSAAAISATTAEVKCIEAGNSNEPDTSAAPPQSRFEDLSSYDFSSANVGAWLKELEKCIVRLEKGLSTMC